ncbi:MAG: mitochondrial fission ELM1 family protein [Beijerinckiaceae bacterium]|nr:mitochondrial fission ELM1 family protein [Beijerinckiaceae bacterium]
MSGLLPPTTRILIVTPDKAGHEVICRGVAQALGGEISSLQAQPRKLYDLLAPWGPADPRTPWPEPLPDIALGSGRTAAPVLHALKKLSGGKVFTVFLHDPRMRRAAFDMIWAPEHDRLEGPNVISTLSSPHTLSPALIADARANPDPRIAGLHGPRLALLLGGPSSAYKYEAHDVAELVRLVGVAIEQGYSVMATPSRRTPAGLTRLVADALAALPDDRRFVWTGEGSNPFLHMIANAEAIVVTADSVNMVGEAAATGAPVHLFTPTGRPRKTKLFLDGMIASGAVRPWSGEIERWSYEPIDATGEIAAQITRSYAARAAQTV